MIVKLRKGGYDLEYGDPLKANSAFQYDINERITGARKGDKRFGWLWYFRQMNDFALLDRVDKILKREMQKDSRTRSIRIKRLKRAFYEISNFTDQNKYILNYGISDPDQIKNLFGEFDRSIERSSTPERTLSAFNAFTAKRLKKLMLDEVRAS